MKITVVKRGTETRKPQSYCPIWIDDVIVDNKTK
jgi:hypothetical protein